MRHASQFHVRLRRPGISGGMARGGKEPLLSVVFGLLLSEHRAFCLFIVLCQAGKMGRDGVFVQRDMLTVDGSRSIIRRSAAEVLGIRCSESHAVSCEVSIFASFRLIPYKSTVPFERIQVIPEGCSPGHMSRDSDVALGTLHMPRQHFRGAE